MTCCWVMLTAILAQTSRPADVSAPARPRITVVATAPASRPEAAAGLAAPAATMPAEAEAGREAAGDSAASIELFEDLSGDLVDVQATTDNNIILYGNERDLAILAKLIEMMDSQPPGLTPTFRIFQLRSAQARDLAASIQQLWDKAHTPISGRARPEDRITIIPEARANLLMVATSEKNMPAVEEIIRQLDQPSIGGELQFTPVQLTHIRAEEAEQVIRDMLKTLQTQRGVSGDLINIKADVRTNRLLVSAPEADLAQIREWLRLIDVEPTPESGGVVKIRIFPLQKAVARELAQSLTDMLRADSDAAKAMKEQIRRLQVELSTRQGTRSLPDVDLDKPIKVLEEKGSNSVIVASTESNLEAIGEIVRLLDTVPLAEEMVVKIFPLKNADADTLKGNLQEMFDKGKNLPTVPGKEEVKGRIPESLTGAALAYDVAVSADKRTNTLIVAGRPEQILLVERIIDAVDGPESANNFAPRLVKLQHADVRRIEEVVKQLAEHRMKMAERLGPLEQERERIVAIADERTNGLIVIARDDNFKQVAELIAMLDGADEDWLGQIHIIPMKTLAAADLAGKIEELWERRAAKRREGGLPEDKPVIVTDARSNSLVIASNREDYEAIARLVAQLEQQPLSPMHDIRQVVLRHNDATKVADTVGRLFEERLKMSLGEGQKEQPSDRVFLIPDALTNTILIASSRSNYDEIVRLITQLDVPPPVDGVIQTFFVRNADVTKAAEMLDKLFKEGVYRGSGPQDLPEAMKKVTIVTDVRSSALIVSGSPENLAICRSLLEEIDRVETPIFQADARFIPIRHADVVNVADMLEQLFQGMGDTLKEDKDQLQVKIIPNVRSNVLIVAGSRYAMQRAEELVPKLDQPLETSTSETRVYRLARAGASRLEPVITRVFEERGKQDQAGKRTPILVIADDGSNSLIVSASRDDHLVVQDLVSKLDQPSSISQQVAIIPLAEAKAKPLADTLTNLLKAQQMKDGSSEAGVAVVPEERTNSIIVFATPDLMGNIETIVRELDNTRPKREMAMRVFQLRNARAADLSKLLDDFFESAGSGKGSASDDARQLIIRFTHTDPETGELLARTLVHQDVTIKPDEYTNSLMVLCPVDHIDMLQTLIEMLDSVEPVTAEIMPFALRNADAEEMKELLENLFEAGGKGGKGEEGRTFILAGGPGGVVGAGGAVSEIAFSVDKRTNTLIAAGSPAHLRIVERLVFQLDDQEIEERASRVVRLQYAKSEEVAKTLQAYFEDEVKLVEEAEEGASAQRTLQRQVTIQDAGETTNALLLSYSPRMEARVVDLINQLDVPPPQVMIQVLMAEVTLTDNFEMGMEFAFQDLLFSETAWTGPNGTIQGDNFDWIAGTDVGAAGSGSLGGISFTVTGEDFNLLLRALQTEGRLEVLSRPAIMVQDNQEAAITVGERVPVVTDLAVSAGGLVTPSVQYEDVGIKLEVKPIINPDGYVNMEIKPEISGIGTSSISVATGVTLPTFTERSAETSVTVKDAETIIIGGLITSRTNSSENKVPLAGDVPFLGNLFKATARQNSKTELLIVLTPHVIRNPYQAQTVSIRMRDQTGLMDEARKNPLMNGLQVRPDEDQFGPVDELRPYGERSAPDESGEEQGPVLDEYGPPTTSIEFGPQRSAMVTRP